MDSNFDTDLTPLFNPKSIAIIGASKDSSKPGGTPAKSLIENNYPGKIYPVNPAYKELNGLPCYKSIDQIPYKIDLAIIAIPANAVLKILENCVICKVKAAIILTSGFSEVGESGQKMQNKIKTLIQKSGLLLCGPNSQGLFNFTNRMSAGFGIAKLPDDYDKANTIGFISQSGGVGTAAFMISKETGNKLTCFVSSGNEAGLSFSDYIAFMVKEPQTRIIAGYLEGVRDGRKLLAAAKLAFKAKKPLIIIKSGRYPATAKAVGSHTGAMAGSENIYHAFFQQKGVIRSSSIEEMHLLFTLLRQNVLARGNRVGIITTSGGRGLILADHCIDAGLQLPTLSTETRQKLDRFLPQYGSSANPVDITTMILTDPGLLAKAVQLVMADKNIDMVIAEHWPSEGGNLERLEIVNRECLNMQKPFMVCMLASERLGGKEMRYLRKNGQPVARTHSLAAQAMGAFVRYSIQRGAN